MACIKQGDPDFRAFVSYLNRLKEKTMLKIATNWYDACCVSHEPKFFAWRNKIKEFDEQGLDDLNCGYYYPYLMPRGIMDPEEVCYSFSFIEKSNEKYFQKIN